ncbi:DUF3000 domain-containing protein [Nesterenkonia muleiensis]|uniref:DUF3000 domain-containing protein n=1 Tax=Nesterenkonia muleiensis TaxID=2282648 RepID=UPI000E7473C2|nr:DUF3000 domain-containing protein [Nesterenkonia muleiensis]
MSVFGPLAGSPARPAPSIGDLPAPFRRAIDELRSAQTRQEAVVEEVPAPSKLAPYAVALRAEIADHSATGRFILLHDPEGQDSWGGTFRVVIYIRAELEPEIGNDPLLASVAWTWLSDSLAQHGVQHSHAGGTATRILSESFGSLESRLASNDVELRASWTPEGSSFGAHLEAWADMVCSFAGLPPLPEGVVALPHLRRS